MAFIFEPLNIPDILLIKPQVFSDNRGDFWETYKSSDFRNNGILEDFVQDNHSVSTKGVLRGLHFQTAPAEQAKLVRVVKGEAWDVSVDMRPDSSTYLCWVAEFLTAENRYMLYVPRGFVHGFVSLSDDTHLVYKCSAEYDRNCERGIRWDDPRIGIDWPIRDPIISEKDAKLPLLKDFLP
jgi:dTDP-4-dehydrorhamnose 3,5-epimerase